MLVVKKLRVIDVGTFDMCGGAVGNGAQIGRQGFGVAPTEALTALAQGFSDYVRDCLPGFPGD